MKILHIKQQHKLPFGIKPVTETINATVQSQFMVAQVLKKHPECPVLLESLYEDASNASTLPFSRVAKTIFPKGFPTNFDELTSLQKDFLYDQGAVFTLFYLGEIPSICKSIHREASEIIDKEISEGAYDKIYTPREIEAIECAKEAIKHFGKTDDATVIIVFGGAHDFKSYCEEHEFGYEEIDTRVTSNLQQSTSISIEESSSAHEQLGLIPKISAKEEKKQDMHDDPMMALNRRLEEYPGDIASRLKRAKIYVGQNNHLKALEDYAYVHDKYPANSDALSGMAICKNLLASEKQSAVESVSKIQSAFFTPSISISSAAIPLELQKALNDNPMLKDCLTMGHVTLENLIDLQQNKPWVVDALRCSNIYKGLCDRYINVEQLGRLTQEQVASVTKINNTELQSKVEAYVKSNQKNI